MKMRYFVIICKNLSNAFLKQMHPSAVLPVRINSHVVSPDHIYRCLALAFASLSLILLGSLILSLDGLPFEESAGAAIAAFGNTGPGLGAQGPAGNYSAVSDLSKWTLSFLMMTGRLEVFTVLTIFLPGFWKQ
jgi:trk system potassium uptake protein TrkH